METKENIDRAVKLLDDNKLELVQKLCVELGEIGMPFVLGDDNNPMVDEDDKRCCNNIYHSICSKFLYKNKMETKIYE